MPSASAVLGDLLDAAHNAKTGGAGRTVVLRQTAIRPVDDVQSEYYLNLEVVDRPGVLAAVASVFGDHQVSIRSMEQVGLGDEARLIFITHTARERDVQACLHDLRGLDVVDQIGSLIRVIGAE
jgi:homoserine dehydrogenase